MSAIPTAFQCPRPAYVYKSVEVTFAGLDRKTAELARDATHPHNLRMLFDRLGAARALMGDGALHGPYRAATAALQTLIKFLGANPYNEDEGFSIPLELLLAELKSAGGPLADRNILHPWQKGQTPERNRRQHINYLKAAAAYVAHRLNENGMKLDYAACVDVAEILKAYKFPVTKNQGAKGLSEAVAKWREKCLQDSENEDDPIIFSFRRFPFFQVALPGSAAQYLRSATDEGLFFWLKSELRNAGFHLPR